MMGVRRPLLAACAICFSLLSFVDCDQTHYVRIRRQAPDPEAEPDAGTDTESEDYAVDYAGNENDDLPKDEPIRDTFTDTQNINEDRFGTDTFDDPAPPPSQPEDKEESKAAESEESKPKKKAKKHKYLKKTLEFLKKVLDPNKLMENAYVTEMLRRFSHNEDPESESKESLESPEVVHTPAPKKRRGRPRKKDSIPPGITGILKKGMMTLSQMELDKKNLRRKMKFIKKIAKKAKKPLKTAVKIFLSSRNQGGYGVGNYGNTNY